MEDEVCVVCGVQIESTKHVFRDCSMARAVWFQSLGLRVDSYCDRISFAQWMITCAHQLPLVGFEFWLMLVWAIWKHMNEVLCYGTRLPQHEIVLRTEGWMHEFH